MCRAKRVPSYGGCSTLRYGLLRQSPRCLGPKARKARTQHDGQSLTPFQGVNDYMTHSFMVFMKIYIALTAPHVNVSDL
jgi:hypothetical protein